MKVLVTSSAGFIGSALVLRLLARGDTVIGIDNHNNYYDPTLKEARLALFKFTKAILAGEPIQVFNHGKHRRDFTYIDDIVKGVIRVLDQPAAGNSAWQGNAPDPGTSTAPWRVYNIGNNQPVELMDCIAALEKALGKTAEKQLLPLQAGDVPDTYADVADLVEQFQYKPATTVANGIQRFVAWYRNEFKLI